MSITKDEALRRIVDRYPCDCEVVRETTPIPVEPGATCRTKWPGQPSEWCAHCLATDALEDECADDCPCRIGGECEKPNSDAGGRSASQP